MRQQLRVETFDGRTIAYEGGEFDGSPQHVFSSRYIEPFLEDLAVKELAAAIAQVPQQVPSSIEREYTSMRDFIDKHVQTERAMWKPRPSYERWYEQNKFWVWAVGTVLAVAGLRSSSCEGA